MLARPYTSLNTSCAWLVAARLTKRMLAAYPLLVSLVSYVGSWTYYASLLAQTAIGAIVARPITVVAACSMLSATDLGASTVLDDRLPIYVCVIAVAARSEASVSAGQYLLTRLRTA